MATYAQKSLASGEHLIVETKIALRAYWFRFTFGAILLFSAFAAGAAAPYPFLVAVFCIVPPLIRYWTNEFSLTNRRVVAKVGWLSLATIEMQLEKIESFRVEQSIVGRMLRYGTVVIVGTGGSRESVPAIPNPVRFRMTFNDAIAGARNPPAATRFATAAQA